jgi:predicted enzyme related to lactoylglutathione lyase
MERSLAFYRDILGLAVAYGSPYYTSFDLGNGVKLGLHPSQSPPGDRRGWVVCFLTADVRALRKTLEAAGAAVEPGYHDIPRGVVMDLVDPDGNRLQATQLGVKAKELA